MDKATEQLMIERLRLEKEIDADRVKFKEVVKAYKDQAAAKEKRRAELFADINAAAVQLHLF